MILWFEALYINGSIDFRQKPYYEGIFCVRLTADAKWPADLNIETVRAALERVIRGY